MVGGSIAYTSSVIMLGVAFGEVFKDEMGWNA